MIATVSDCIRLLFFILSHNFEKSCKISISLDQIDKMNLKHAIPPQKISFHGKWFSFAIFDALTAVPMKMEVSGALVRVDG